MLTILVAVVACTSNNKPIVSFFGQPAASREATDLQSEGSINLGYGYGTGFGGIPFGGGYGLGNCGGYRPQLHPSASYTFGNPYGGYYG